MANKSVLFSIFVLREYFTGTNYPRELILLIMQHIINERNILEIKISQVKIFKNVFSMMGDIIYECCIRVSHRSFRISEISAGSDKLIKLRLTNFDILYCEESELYMGINLEEFNNQLISINDTNCPITLCIRNDTKYILRICSDSKEMKHILHECSFKYTLLPKIIFEHKCVMNYEEFDILCEKLNKISKFFTIDSNGIRSCDSDSTKQQSFELKSLLVLRPHKELCASIIIREKKDFPLVIRISVGTLGTLLYFISPLQ